MILGKVISFLTRNDGVCKFRARRRFGSSRASVFLEYAIILPLAVLTISTMVEFAAFWDAKIMANHTAWTCARIASVEAGQITKYVDKPEVNRLRTEGMKTATVLLMSTCAMGSMHGSSSEFTKHWFEELIMKPLQQLRQALTEGLNRKLVEVLKNLIGRFVSSDVISELVQKLVDWLAERLFDPLVQKLVDIINRLFDPIFRFIGGVLDGQRQLRQLAYAAGRVAEFPDIITVTERTDTPFVFAKQPTVFTTGDWRLDFPRVLDSSASSDTWFVKDDAPWPPNGQRQRMIDVKISWPFERAWMFPVLSQARLSAEDAKSLEGVPTAVGRAMAYPQPIICNDNLKSEGAEPYDPGNTNAVPEIVNKIMDKYVGFLKVAALYYHYQTTDEQIGPHDSKKGGSGTYKGIGVYGGEGRKSGEDKYYQHDGLVYWMGRAPDNKSEYSDQGAWRRKARPADYYRCWQEVAETDNEQTLFWNGEPFFAANRPKAAYWRLKKKHHWDEWLAGEGSGYQDKEWFFWGDGVNRHLRIKHRKPVDNYNSLDCNENWTRFVMPRDTGKTSHRGIGKGEFEARVPDPERGIVTYDQYSKVQNNDKDRRLRSNLRTLVDVWCNQGVAKAVMRDEPAAFELVRKSCESANGDTLVLVKACSQELDAAVGGGGGGGGTDPKGLMDVGMTDDEIMKDPNKAAEIIEKKLNELKPKVYAAVRRIDKAEQALRDIDKGMNDKLNGWRKRRDVDLIDFAVAIARAAAYSGSTDASAVCNWLKGKCDGKTVTAVTEEIKAYFLAYRAAIVEWYNAELELGKLLNCKAAKDVPPKRPDPDPVDPPDPNPHRPPISSPESGSDNDYGGDSWTLREDGWYKDGGGSDI